MKPCSGKDLEIIQLCFPTKKNQSCIPDHSSVNMWKFELFYRPYSAHTIHSVLNAKMYFQKFYWFHLLWHFRQIWFDLEVFFLILSKSLGIHQTDANIYIFNIIFFLELWLVKFAIIRLTNNRNIAKPLIILLKW